MFFTDKRRVPIAEYFTIKTILTDSGLRGFQTLQMTNRKRSIPRNIHKIDGIYSLTNLPKTQIYSNTVVIYCANCVIFAPLPNETLEIFEQIVKLKLEPLELIKEELDCTINSIKENFKKGNPITVYANVEDLEQSQEIILFPVTSDYEDMHFLKRFLNPKEKLPPIMYFIAPLLLILDLILIVNAPIFINFVVVGRLWLLLFLCYFLIGGFFVLFDLRGYLEDRMRIVHNKALVSDLAPIYGKRLLPLDPFFDLYTLFTKLKLYQILLLPFTFPFMLVERLLVVVALQIVFLQFVWGVIKSRNRHVTMRGGGLC